MNFQMISSFEDLSARFTRMRHKSALVLVAHVPQQRALQVEHPRTDGALKLGAFRRLAHRVHGVRVRDPLEAGGGGAQLGRGGGARPPKGRGRALAPTPNAQTSV